MANNKIKGYFLTIVLILNVLFSVQQAYCAEKTPVFDVITVNATITPPIAVLTV
jgi:hypothetical protein